MDHRTIERKISATAAVKEQTQQHLIRQVMHMTSWSEYEFPDAALPFLLPLIISAMECEGVRASQKALLWSCYYRLLDRLEAIQPGLAGSLELDQVAGLDAVELLDERAQDLDEAEWDAFTWSTDVEGGVA